MPVELLSNSAMTAFSSFFIVSRCLCNISPERVKKAVCFDNGRVKYDIALLKNGYVGKQPVV